MKSGDSFLHDRLAERERDGNLRKLITQRPLVDFTSNDYLGVVHDGLLNGLHDDLADGAGHASGAHAARSGSTGSRLLTGNSAFAEELEKRIARFHGAAAGLLFSSGYDANLGLLSAILRSGDAVIYDEQSHASIHDGIHLGHGLSYPFKHNDLAHLEARLRGLHAARAFVVVESIYSMDGDLAPLTEMARLCAAHGANFIIDEAHATGVFGERGRGLAGEPPLAGPVFARVYTFGKALGCHGAIVLGSEMLRTYLINFARPFIYSTAPPEPSLRAIAAAYDLLPNLDEERAALQELIGEFRASVESWKANGSFLRGGGPIQGYVIPGNAAARELSGRLQEAGFDVRAILSPTVRKGQERIRISLHSFNTKEEIAKLFAALRELQ